MAQSGSPLGDYLRAKRNQLRPETVGLQAADGRRVDGLRREEVAARAGISREYYLRLEQGRDKAPSDQVLIALASALHLPTESVFYMRRLVAMQASSRPGRAPIPSTAAAERLVEMWETVPVVAFDRHLDVIAANQMAGQISDGAVSRGANLALLAFSASARHVLHDWGTTAERLLAALRYHGDHTHTRYQEIVGILSIRDLEFAQLWARHDAYPWDGGEISVRWAGLRPFTLRFQNLRIPGEDFTLAVTRAEQGSQAAAVLAYLPVAPSAEERRA